MRGRLSFLFILFAATACSGASPAVRSSTPPPSSTASQSPSSGGFVFAVKGDWGGGTQAQRDITSRMCEVRKTIPFKYVVTTGDNFYNPDGNATQANFYGPERCLNDFPGNVWRAVWGNHDLGGPSTRTILGAPRYYTWSVDTASAGVTQFFMLDANDPGSRTQRAWLTRALTASRARVKIVVFHQPAFTSGLHSDNGAAQRSWVPLFEQHHVTLVLTGHNHDYEHLKVGAIDYVVTGGGGESVYPCIRVEPGAIRCVSAYNFLLVRVAASGVVVEALRASGARLDRFEIAL